MHPWMIDILDNLERKNSELKTDKALLEIRLLVAVAEIHMHERADKVIAEIGLQHHEAMIQLDAEHKARMKVILTGWWIGLSTYQRLEWFTAWNDFNYNRQECGNKNEFERSVFAFMSSLPHIHSLINPKADISVYFNGEVAHAQAR